MSAGTPRPLSTPSTTVAVTAYPHAEGHDECELDFEASDQLSEVATRANNDDGARLECTYYRPILPAISRLTSWPAHRAAQGMVSVQKYARRSRTLSGGGKDAMLSLRDGMLTLHLESQTQRGEFTHEMAVVPVNELLVTLEHGRFNMLCLSLESEPEVTIMCFCKDQTVRNKWVAILRRIQGVTFRAGRYGSE